MNAKTQPHDRAAEQAVGEPPTVAGDVLVDRVSKRYREVAALDDVSVQAPAGSFFSLLGPSGSGKSTLLRVISGFEFPDSGRVSIGGREMTTTPPNVRPTALVFQRWALFPHLSALENVAFGLRARRQRRQAATDRARELLELVGLTGLERRKPGQMSGGQQQRVALARALAIQPRVLLLDEPLASLDLKLRVQMQLELKRLQREVGTTFVFVTHDQGEAMTMSDQIAVINNGRIEQVGSPTEIYDRPASAFVASFIGDTNLIDVVADGTSGLRAGELRIVAPPDASLDPGADHALSIRGERMRLGTDLDCANSFAGQIREVVFKGRVLQYTVWLDQGEVELTVEAAYHGNTGIHSRGDRVRVGWDPAAATVVRR